MIHNSSAFEAECLKAFDEILPGSLTLAVCFVPPHFVCDLNTFPSALLKFVAKLFEFFFRVAFEDFRTRQFTVDFSGRIQTQSS